MTTVQDLLSARWRVPAEGFRTVTSDGVELAGSRLGDASPERVALVAGHGLMGWHRKPRIARFAEALTPWFTVYAFDFRGHGRSRGTCTTGDREIEDVEAVVRLARERRHARVVSLGTSMGAIAVVRHAGLVGGVDEVVSISGPNRWGSHHAEGDPRRERAWKRLVRLTGTDRGRRILRAYGVRLAPWEDEFEAPGQVVGKIAPTPLLIVHGRDDHLFGPDEATDLFEAAGEPKRLLMADRFGHAEDGLSPELARRLAREIYGNVGLPWPA